jgi:uroporphyrinogen-III decarboxylase
MPRAAILGNMDPPRFLLRGTPDSVHEELARCHRVIGPRFVVGAGCEVPKFTPLENFRALVRYAQQNKGVAAAS